MENKVHEPSLATTHSTKKKRAENVRIEKFSNGQTFVENQQCIFHLVLLVLPVFSLSLSYQMCVNRVWLKQNYHIQSGGDGSLEWPIPTDTHSISTRHTKV